MANFDFGLEFVSGSLGFLYTDFDGTMREEVHKDLPDIAEMVNERIQARTPVNKGGLVASETFEIDPNPQSDQLVYFYTEEGPQIEAWGRVYGAYVEGDPLGLPSWTISDPAQMYYRTQTEDLDTIDEWFQVAVDYAAYRITNGGGKHF